MRGGRRQCTAQPDSKNRIAEIDEEMHELDEKKKRLEDERCEIVAAKHQSEREASVKKLLNKWVMIGGLNEYDESSPGFGFNRLFYVAGLKKWESACSVTLTYNSIITIGLQGNLVRYDKGNGPIFISDYTHLKVLSKKKASTILQKTIHIMSDMLDDLKCIESDIETTKG